MKTAKSNIREIPYPAAMQHKDVRRSRFAHSLPRIVSIEHYVLNFNGECNGSIPFLSPKLDDSFINPTPSSDAAQGEHGKAGLHSRVRLYCCS